MSLKVDWIKNKLKENNFDKSKVYCMLPEFQKETGSDFWSEDTYKRYVRQAFSRLVADGEIDCSDELIKLESNKQKIMDTNNLLRKSNRENYRLYNTLEETYKEYVKQLDKINVPFTIKSHKSNSKSKCGILQLSDIHCNEIINPQDSGDNVYNFDVLSKRMKKFVSESVKHFITNNVSDVYIFMTGDLMNSSRRLSESLLSCNSLTSASLLLTYILEQVIIELSQKFNVHVSFAIGNESRICVSQDQNMDNSNILASTNWDYLIFHNLRQIFRKKKVDFITPKNNVQSVVTLKDGFNALITHGHILKGGIDKFLPSLLQQYSYKGTRIHGVFYGHFHHSLISDIASQSGSLCGGNSFTSNTCLYLTKPSQNIYITDKDSYTGIKIDLQNIEGYQGYDIIEELEQYSSTDRSCNNTVIIKNLV